MKSVLAVENPWSVLWRDKSNLVTLKSYFIHPANNDPSEGLNQVSLFGQAKLIRHVYNSCIRPIWLCGLTDYNETGQCECKSMLCKCLDLTKVITKLWFTEWFFSLSIRSDGTKVEWSTRAAMVDVAGSLVSCDCWCTLAAPQDLVVMFGGCSLRCCCIREVVWGGPRGTGANTL